MSKPTSSTAVRIRTAVLLLLVTLSALSSTAEWPLYVLASAFSFFAAMELKALAGFKSFVGVLIALVASVAGVLLLTDVMVAPYAALIAVLVGTAAIVVRTFRNAPGWTDFLILGWLAGPLACALWLHKVSVDPSRFFSPNLLLLVLLPIWIGDTAAYFIGRKFGKHKLAPTISPGKTWEGAIANFIACAATAMIVGRIMDSGMDASLPWTAALGVGVCTGILGQLGDLLQSALKRSSSLKDSGFVLPGHGGVLDRVDSFLLASVPSSLLLWWLARECMVLASK